MTCDPVVFIWTSGDRGDIVALMHAKPRPANNPEFREATCPRVALVWRVGAKLKQRELAVEGGAADDDDLCCQLTSISAGTLDGQTQVRVSGAGHPCRGGTAYDGTDVIYTWTGKALASPLDLSVWFHRCNYFTLRLINFWVNQYP